MDIITPGFSPLGIILIVSTIVVILITFYYASRYVLLNWVKVTDKRKAKAGAWLMSLLLTPLSLVIGIYLLALYFANTVVSEADAGKELEESAYEIMDEHVGKLNLVGKSRKEVVALLGTTDTTKAKWEYDLSVNKEFMKNELNYSASEYILVIEFNNGKVVSYYHKE